MVGRGLKHQGTFKIDGFENAVLNHLKPARAGDAVQAQAVLQRVDFGQQFALQGFKLRDV